MNIHAVRHGFEADLQGGIELCDILETGKTRVDTDSPLESMRIVQHVSNWVAGTNSSTPTLYKRNTISTRITTWTTLPCHPPVTNRVRFKT